MPTSEWLGRVVQLSSRYLNKAPNNVITFQNTSVPQLLAQTIGR